MIFFKKIWKKIKEYWQIFVGLFVGLGFAIKFWWQLQAQKKILKNTIDSEKKIHAINEEHDKSVKDVEEKAKKDHEGRVVKINLKNEKAKKDAQKELEDRITENTNVSNDDLADRIANTLDVNVVKTHHDDEIDSEENSNEK